MLTLNFAKRAKIGRVFGFSTAAEEKYNKTELMEHSLKNVKKYGWNIKAIKASCLDLGLSPASHRLLHPY